MAGIWSAVAPQIHFSLGERLRLGFGTITVTAGAVALLAGLRYAPRADLFWKARFADGVVQFSRAANELIVVAPMFLLLLALQSVSLTELIRAVVMIFCALLLSTSVATVRGPTLLVPVLILTAVAMRRRTNFESTLICLYAAHFYFKSHVAFEMWRAMRSPNLTLETLAPLSPAELCELRRQSFRFLSPALIALAASNTVILLLVNVWPIKIEQILPLALVLAFGIVSLFLDTFALRWRGMIGNPLLTIGIVMGIPWAVAWAFAALHTGEAFTMNEGAAYFFLWTVLGSTLSWMVGNAAKQKALRDFRRLAAASLCP